MILIDPVFTAHLLYYVHVHYVLLHFSPLSLFLSLFPISQLQLMIPPSDWESICSSTSRNTTPAVTTFPQSDQSPSHHTLDTNSLDDDKEGSLSLEPSITSNVVEEPKRVGEL